MEGVKVGVFICHCGKNIAGTVNVNELLEFAKTIPGVAIAKDYMFLCSELGQEIIKEALTETQAKRVVVASCSPKLHEQTFRRCIEEVGLNKFFLEMANIREHCSWVHMNEPELATEKAKALVRAAVERAKELEEVGTRRERVLENVLVIGGGIAGLEAAREIARPTLGKENLSVLVVGGGIAGIQAALDLGDQGFKVFLVERRPVIGGNMARVYKTFPTDDCAMCILSPKMNDIASHPNVQILSYSEVKSVEGSVGDFKVRIEKKPRYVDESKCTGCGACAEK
ncbi:CoB--CoM heterodisulfide reductase iron-sulfur subunit A family protein, partial [bacterium]